jgi:hypothetical protein
MIAVNTRVATRDEVPAGTPLLERVCSFCRRTLGWVVCVAENDGEQSHGACESCARRERTRMNAAAAYMAREYTLEIGAASDEPATQAATPTGQQGREDTASAGAENTKAPQALRAPVSSSLSAARGADAAGTHSRVSVIPCPTENAPDCGPFQT